METIDIESIITIEKWVWNLLVDHRLVSLILIGKCGIPTKGLAPWWGLVICSFIACPLPLHSMENATSGIMTGMVSFWFHIIVVCWSLFNDFRILIIVIMLWFLVTGMVRRGMVLRLQNKKWENPYLMISLLTILHLSPFGFMVETNF